MIYVSDLYLELYLKTRGVASSKERIEDAKEAWRAEAWESNPRFHLPPGDDREFIPLPER